MNFISLLVLLVSFGAMAGARIECTSASHSVVVEAVSPQQLKITFRGETVLADGLMNGQEVDLVARFSSIGEMTLFAKVGQNSPENYMFIQGKRISVVCR